MTGSGDRSPPRGALGRRGPTAKFAAKRASIVRAAIEEINRNGVRGTTLAGVAARLGLTQTAVIYYFASKEDLAAEVFLGSIRRFDEMIARAAAGEDPAERVRRFIQAFFDDRRRILAGEVEGLAVFNDIRALNAPEVNEAYVAMFRRARRLLDGPTPLPPAHRNARTHLLLSQLFWIVVWLDHVAPEDFDRTAERMARIVNDGFAAAAANWPAPPALSLFEPEAAGPALTTEQFLRAATELINEEGYHGASVDRISARLQLSKGAFYHHHETKDELVVACFRRTLDITWRAIRGAEARAESGLEALVAVASALVVRQLSGDAPLLRTSALTTVPKPIHEELVKAFDRVSFRFASILSDGVNDGSIACADVNIAAQMITGAINAAAEVVHWAPGIAPETVVGRYVRPLVCGLASPPRD